MNIRNPLFPERVHSKNARESYVADVRFDQAASTLALSIDAIVIVATGVAAGCFYNLAVYGVYGDFSVLFATGVIVAVPFCWLARAQADRDNRASSTPLGRAHMAAVAWVTTFLVLIVLAFSLKVSTTFSRGVVFAFFAVGSIVVPISRMVTPRLLAQWKRNNAYRALEMLIIAPSGHPGTPVLCAQIAEQGCTKIHCIEFGGTKNLADWAAERQRLLKQVFDVARSAASGDIYFLAGDLSLDLVASVASGLRILPRAVHLVPNEQVSRLLQYPLSSLAGVLTLEMQKAPLTVAQRAVKRSLDLFIAMVTLVFLTPLLAAIALALKLESNDPLLFRQWRRGYRGHLFQILKFRTMTILEDNGTVIQASRNDSRVTPVGKWLRRTSLDELPQLWNVLIGEMSVVGPRPHAAAHDAMYSRSIENYEVRQHVKPGITGWAQVHGLRGETAKIDLMRRRIEMDIWYACNSGLILDVRILFMTITAVLSQHNAF